MFSGLLLVIVSLVAVTLFGILLGYLKSTGRSILVEHLKPLEAFANETRGRLVQEGRQKIDLVIEETSGRIETLISARIEQILNLGPVPPGHQPFGGGWGHVYLITDDPIQPFQITGEIAAAVDRIIAGNTTEEEKARSIFLWFGNEITYDYQKAVDIDHNKDVTYLHADEVFKTRRAVCGEMAILYIVMARYAGLSAHYAKVNKDIYGKKVRHACVTLDLADRTVQVDPAYTGFNIRHQEITVLTDGEAISHFKAIRGGKA
jgi:transglutaminase-like putative cysteine protease